MLSLVPLDLPPADPFATRSPASALETRFPRIARELINAWHTPSCERYLNDLLLHSRDTREGFPAEVQEELMFLSGLLWHLSHDGYGTTGSGHARPRSYSEVNEMELRHAGTRGAWIL